MEANKILSANILDLIFDGRNKEYGAYELRATYARRVKRSLIVVFVITSLAIGGTVLANYFKPKHEGGFVIVAKMIPPLIDDEKQKIPPPEKQKPAQAETKTIKVTTPRIVPEDVDPPPTEDDKTNAKISALTKDGPPDDGTVKAPEDLDNKGIIEPKKAIDEGPVAFVEIEAKFTGNWEKFLTRNLNGNVPGDNGAPAGSYTVIIQFVVDLEGNVSDIKALTAHGYGMEDEAIRVLRKATKWEPAIQNGHNVKAYRKQPITFVVE